MIVTVASGKGGTGKTTVAVSLALSLATEQESVTALSAKPHPANPLLLDCDVEEPNAALFLKQLMLPSTVWERREVGQMIPEVDFEKCTYCGRCAEVCQYHAIAVVGERRSGAAPVLVFKNSRLVSALFIISTSRGEQRTHLLMLIING